MVISSMGRRSGGVLVAELKDRAFEQLGGAQGRCSTAEVLRQWFMGAE